MTPQEKAKELGNKFYIDVMLTQAEAKQCALIAVDEIMDAVDWHEFEVPNDVLQFYFKVKQEIEKL
jgi:hypothetical protein